MEKKITESPYLKRLISEADLPEGFKTGRLGIRFKPEELDTDDEMKMNLSMILLDRPAESFAGVFTRNKFPGAPVLMCRERLKSPSLRAIVINNKIANVCVESGPADAEAMAAAVAGSIGCDPKEVMTSSTGVIGWRLPVAAMQASVPELHRIAGEGSENAVALAEGIMTTDRFPKLRTRKLFGGRITAVAKGAGMIEPNMATMLCFVMTDIAIDRESLREMLPGAATESFNRISVDSDQSTSDMVIAVSSGMKPCTDIEKFREALHQVCAELAEDIVRNGEGTGHVISVAVEGAPDTETAVAVGKAVVNSPLVKTAVAGNDPNVGRLASSIGDYCGNNNIEINRNDVRITLGGEIIFSEGCLRLDSKKELRLVKYLNEKGQDPALTGYPEHEEKVEIKVELKLGSSNATVLGSDLTHEYVSENADYRT